MHNSLSISHRSAVDAHVSWLSPAAVSPAVVAVVVAFRRAVHLTRHSRGRSIALHLVRDYSGKFRVRFDEPCVHRQVALSKVGECNEG